MAQIQINLLTREFRGGGDSLTEHVIKWVAVGAVIVLLGAGAAQFVRNLLAAGDLGNLQAELDRSRKKVEQLKPITSLDDGIKKFEILVDGAHKSSPSSNSMLTAVQAKTPDGVSLITASFKEGGADLNLEAKAFGDVEKFIDSLRQDKGIAAVELQSLVQDAGKPIMAQINIKFAKGGPSK